LDESHSRKWSSEHRLRAMTSVSYRTARWLSPKMTKSQDVLARFVREGRYPSMVYLPVVRPCMPARRAFLPFPIDWSSFDLALVLGASGGCQGHLSGPFRSKPRHHFVYLSADISRPYRFIVTPQIRRSELFLGGSLVLAPCRVVAGAAGPNLATTDSVG
jgi:hypothetical protein